MAKTADVSKSFVKEKIPPAFLELLEKPFSYPVLILENMEKSGAGIMVTICCRSTLDGEKH
jgi:hypothetical protein